MLEADTIKEMVVFFSATISFFVENKIEEFNEKLHKRFQLVNNENVEITDIISTI